MRALPADVPYVGSRASGVLLFGDEPQRRERLADAIMRAGGRVVASGPLSAAMERLDQRVASVVVDIGADDGKALDAILDRLNGLGASSGRLSALVLTPAELIDVVAARIDDPGVGILVDPDATERDAALSELIALPAGRVTEDGEADRRRRLAQLGEEVGRIARALAALSAAAAEPSSAAPNEAAAPQTSDAPLVRAILRLRRLRGQHFEPALFADPAWDILLDLAAARIEGRMVAVSSLCIAAAVPATTALRWISQMTDQELLVRHPDAHDGRRVFIALADASATAMDAYLAAARRVMASAA
jgi:DNA-binding MarR family transcriptional regulator